jgi:hypothetical protein
MVHAARQARKESVVWVRKRLRRRVLGVALALVYAGAFAWLISPLWSAASAPSAERPPVVPGPADRPIGIAPLASSKALPTSLPGSSEVAAASPEAGGAEVTGESETESAPVVSEGGEEPVDASPTTESSPPPEKIVSDEG